ncbi:hypothetical protein GOE08_17060 [Sinorhizobium medicae]|nr:hypothetical protein [Sinorhizobium medicae]
MQFRSFENEVRKIDNICAYRIIVTEQSSDNTASSIKDPQTLLSQQAGALSNSFSDRA